jgi:SOS-response transcriptional repressor LexA
MKHLLWAALVIVGFVELSNGASAQSSDAISRRLDALEKDNAALRDRMRQIEGKEKENTASQTLFPIRGDPNIRDGTDFISVSQPPTKVDVTRYISASAVSMTILVSVTPPTGTAMIYTEGNEDSPIVFKGPQTLNEIRLSGPFIYVKLIGATSFDIRYMNYREP